LTREEGIQAARRKNGTPPTLLFKIQTELLQGRSGLAERGFRSIFGEKISAAIASALRGTVRQKHSSQRSKCPVFIRFLLPNHRYCAQKAFTSLLLTHSTWEFGWGGMLVKL